MKWQEQSACGFDGDMYLGVVEGVAERKHFGEQHGFATSEHYVFTVKLGDLPKYFFHRQVVALWVPRCKWRVAVVAAQVASRCAYKNAGSASEQAFALCGLVNFGNAHEIVSPVNPFRQSDHHATMSGLSKGGLS